MYQTVIHGVFPKIASSKRKYWPKFTLNLIFLTFSNYTHATILGKAIAEMNLRKAPKIMHDTKSLLANHFLQEHTKIAYDHHDAPDDSLYIGTIDFS